MKCSYFQKTQKWVHFSFFSLLFLCYLCCRSEVGNSPAVCDSEPSHRDVVTLGAKIQQREQVSGEGGGQVQLGPRHHAEFVPLHHQPSKQDPQRHCWQIQHTWKKMEEIPNMNLKLLAECYDPNKQSAVASVVLLWIT